jgi:hypothetical protein
MAGDADLPPLPIGPLSNRSSPTISSAPRIAVVLAAALTLGACNADQGVNPSSQRASGVVAGAYFPDYNPNNPISYAQTSGFYGGR